MKLPKESLDKVLNRISQPLKFEPHAPLPVHARNELNRQVKSMGLDGTYSVDLHTGELKETPKNW